MTKNENGISKWDISVGDTVILIGGTVCRVVKGWHGKDDAWLIVEFNRGGIPRQIDIEKSEIKIYFKTNIEIANG